MQEQKGGQCVCGAVSYTIVGEPKRVTICHCRWCQRRTSSTFGVEVVFEASQITINDRAVSATDTCQMNPVDGWISIFAPSVDPISGLRLKRFQAYARLLPGPSTIHPGCSRTGTSDGTYSHAQRQTGRLFRTTLKAMKTISDRIHHKMNSCPDRAVSSELLLLSCPGLEPESLGQIGKWITAGLYWLGMLRPSLGHSTRAMRHSLNISCHLDVIPLCASDFQITYQI